MPYSAWRKLTWMNRNWIGKLQISSSHRKTSVRKGVLTNFAKFTGKHPCQGLPQHLFFRAPPGDCFLSNTTTRLYFLKEIVLAYFQSLLGRSNRDILWENEVFWENKGKVHDGVRGKEFSFVNLQFAEAAAGAVL